MKKTLIVVPAYNEEASIDTFLQTLFQQDIIKEADVLVVNDASTDETEQIVKKYPAQLLNQIYNMGYGTALQVAYKYAAKKGYDYLLQLDADGQHDVCNLEKLLNCLKTKDEHGTCPDIVIGSRFLKGSESFPMSGIRKVAIQLFRWIIRTFLKKRITDPTSGLQGLSKQAFTYYAGYRNFDYRYPDTNMIVQMVLLGYQVTEIPAVMHERKAGVAMHSGIIKPVKYMILMMLGTWCALMRRKRS